MIERETETVAVERLSRVFVLDDETEEVLVSVGVVPDLDTPGEPYGVQLEGGVGAFLTEEDVGGLVLALAELQAEADRLNRELKCGV